MLPFSYTMPPGIENYADHLTKEQKHIINSDFERKEMSEIYKTIHFLVRQMPENKR